MERVRSVLLESGAFAESGNSKTLVQIPGAGLAAQTTSEKLAYAVKLNDAAEQMVAAHPEHAEEFEPKIRRMNTIIGKFVVRILNEELRKAAKGPSKTKLAKKKPYDRPKGS